MARIVISDASVLIGLAMVDGLDWLPKLFGTVWIPKSVKSEVLPGLDARGEKQISQAIKKKQLKVWSKPALAHLVQIPDLDEGEADCIRIASYIGVSQSLLLIDERAGRAVAKDLGIHIAGTAAVIGLAKRKKLITSAKAQFAILHASDFRISAAVIKTVLESVDEPY